MRLIYILSYSGTIDFIIRAPLWIRPQPRLPLSLFSVLVHLPCGASVSPSGDRHPLCVSPHCGPPPRWLPACRQTFWGAAHTLHLLAAVQPCSCTQVLPLCPPQHVHSKHRWAGGWLGVVSEEQPNVNCYGETWFRTAELTIANSQIIDESEQNVPQTWLQKCG